MTSPVSRDELHHLVDQLSPEIIDVRRELLAFTKRTIEDDAHPYHACEMSYADLTEDERREKSARIRKLAADLEALADRLHEFAWMPGVEPASQGSRPR